MNRRVLADILYDYEAEQDAQFVVRHATSLYEGRGRTVEEALEALREIHRAQYPDEPVRDLEQYGVPGSRLPKPDDTGEPECICGHGQMDHAICSVRGRSEIGHCDADYCHCFRFVGGKP